VCRTTAARRSTRAAILGSIVLDTATAVVFDVNRRFLSPCVFALLTLLDKSCTTVHNTAVTECQLFLATYMHSMLLRRPMTFNKILSSP